MPELLNRPIFFIGAPRSGTTIIFESFSSHENLSWFSNRFHKHPTAPIVSLFSRLTFLHIFWGAKAQSRRKSFLKKHLPYASECYPVWQHLCGKKFLFDFLLEKTANEIETKKTIHFIKKVMLFQGKDRFTAKITGPSRITFLNSIFPDAIFVHIIRDGRAVVNSIMKVRFWKRDGGYKNPWWTNGLTDEDMEVYENHDKSPLALAAVQWRRIIYAARNEALGISEDRYLEIKYEDFMNDPYDSMSKLLDRCVLNPSSRVYNYMRSIQFKNMNFKYTQSIRNDHIAMLNDIMGDLLIELGYSVV